MTDPVVVRKKIQAFINELVEMDGVDVVVVSHGTDHGKKGIGHAYLYAGSSYAALGLSQVTYNRLEATHDFSSHDDECEQDAGEGDASA